MFGLLFSLAGTVIGGSGFSSDEGLFDVDQTVVLEFFHVCR